jgi:hypothetical protein
MKLGGLRVFWRFLEVFEGFWDLLGFSARFADYEKLRFFRVFMIEIMLGLKE